jgi:hypothetical protein
VDVKGYVENAPKEKIGSHPMNKENRTPRNSGRWCGYKDERW